MINFSILSGEKVRKIAIVQASLIGLVILMYLLMAADTRRDIRLPKGSAVQSDTMKLGNGLDVLLLSDPAAVQSAVAMSVGTGSREDDIPGLAHFVEHLLFIASEKYTTPDQFSTFITENGGTTNAFTDHAQTNFHFEVKHSALQQALDMFAGFFTHPLFPSDRVTDEVKAVNSEYQKNLLSDEWREMRLIQLLADEHHPYHHFSIGSSETLYRENLLELAQTFFQKWYRGGNMKLVVMSNQQLRLLRMWISRAFAFVPRGPVPQRHFTQPFTSFNKVALAPRVSEGQTLSLLWPLPPQTDNRETLPIPFIKYLLNLETPDGISAVLRNRKLANSAVAAYWEDYADFSMLGMSFELTSTGLKDWRECVREVTSYIASLADLSREEMKAVWDYYLAISNLRFDYQTELEGKMVAALLAENMHKFPKPQYLTGNDVPQQFDYQLIRAYLRNRLQHNVLAVLMSPRFHTGKTFDGHKLLLDNSERYFDIDYEVMSIQKRGKPEVKKLHLPKEFDGLQPTLAKCRDCEPLPVKLDEGTWLMVLSTQFDKAALQPVASVSILFRALDDSVSTRVFGELATMQLALILSEDLAKEVQEGAFYDILWKP